MSDDWRKMTALALGEGIETGRIDPRDLTETFLAAASTHPERDRIFTKLTPERARAEAEAARARARNGVRRHPLDGVPISWKDLCDSAGDVTGAGSAMLADRAPAAADCTALARATRAGMVCIGKTHMTELAFSGLGLNPVTATPPNRHDPDWAPGGSSSGAGAAVAHGLSPASIGSDTGGSVRIPAGWQDLVGLKTTLGLAPVDGTTPLAAWFDTLGPLCTSVADAAAITSVMASTPLPDLGGASLSGVRLLVEEETMLADAEDEVRSAFEAGIEAMRAAGATVVRAPIPEFGEALALSLALVVGEAWAEWGHLIEERGDLMFHQVRRRFESGRNVSARDYIQARRKIEDVRARYLARTAGFDAVAAPTTPIRPPSVSRLLTDAAYFERINLIALRNTRIGNLLGLCALTLPTPTPACGFMLMAKPFDEGRLCRVGAAAERALAA